MSKVNHAVHAGAFAVAALAVAAGLSFHQTKTVAPVATPTPSVTPSPTPSVTVTPSTRAYSETPSPVVKTLR